MPRIQKITPCLWFDTEAEAAVAHYTAIFPNSREIARTHYGQGMHKPQGTVLTIVFELDGERVMALNGGPEFKFSESISMSVACETQDEIDHYWEKLTGGGKPVQCGWLKDKFGLSWQVVPSQIQDMLSRATPEQSQRLMAAILGMVKLDIAALERAYRGA